ncbi:MAG: hypothetical protein ABIO19_02510 [Burkholderiaceae bacterium]
MKKPSPAAAMSVGLLRSVKGLSRHKRAAKTAPHLFHGPLDISPRSASGMTFAARASQSKKILKIIKKGEKYGSIVTADITI